MSNLYIEQTIPVIKLVLNKKTGGTETIYCSFDYWEADQLYSGSPEILPILARSPHTERRAGRVRGELVDTSIELFGQTHSNTYGLGLIDRGDEYEWNNSEIEIRKYWKATGAITTHSDASNIRKTGKISEIKTEGDVIIIVLRDVWFKEKELCKKLQSANFTDLEDDWIGEYGSVAFGYSVIVPVCFIEDTAISSSQQDAALFLAHVATGHPLNAFNQLYARNTESPNDPEWVPVTIDTTGNKKIHGNQYELGLGDAEAALNEGRCVVFSPGPGDNKILYAVTLGLVRTAVAPASTDGEARLWIARAPNFLSSAGVWQEERILREMRIDFVIGTTLAVSLGVLDRPLVLTENENYIIGYEWSKPGAANGYKLRTKTVGTNSNDNPQKRNNTNRGEGWAAISEDPYIALYGLTRGPSAFVDTNGTAPLKYSYYDLRQNPYGTLVPSVVSGGTDGKLNRGLQLQASITALEDDGSGTYTGTANDVIRQPADLIRFLLLEDEIGLGLSSGLIDSSSFDTVRANNLADLAAMGFYKREYLLIGTLIEEICFQSRIRIYKTRAGKLALNYPTRLPPTQTYTVTESAKQNDLQIVQYSDLADSDVVNDFLFSYGPDPLNRPKDDKIALRSGTDKYSGIQYLNASENSISDSTLQASMSSSESMYGKRQMRSTLWAYGSTSTMPATLMRYYAERYGKKQKRITVRLPIVDYNAAELFQTMNIQHTDLPAAGGTFKRIQWHDNGTSVQWYDEGIPIEWASLGIVKGEIVGLAEVDDWVYVTVETMFGFEG